VRALLGRLAELRRLNVADPQASARDLARFVHLVDETLRVLPELFSERQRPGRETYTPATERAALRFGEVPGVNTASGDVRLYLPAPSSTDVGRTVAFVKTSSSNAALVRPSDGLLINNSSELSVSPVGYFTIVWHGSGWWMHPP
jgi:hypothetical protein